MSTTKSLQGTYVLDEDGNPVTVSLDAGVRRINVTGKVSVVGAVPPPDTTPVIIYADTPLTVATHETSYVIPDTYTFYLQQMICGNEDPTKGAVTEVYFYDVSAVTYHLVTRVYTSGFTVSIGFSDISVSRDGTPLLGNGSDTIVVRRSKYSGTNIAIDAEAIGYII